MLELRIINGGASLPIFDLPAALGRRGAVREIGDTIDGLIAFLDDLSGDPDLEETSIEDGFAGHHADGPGCPLADPDFGVDDTSEVGKGGDQTYPEWHTLPASQRRTGLVSGKLLREHWRGDHEDDEDGGDTELNGDERDANYAEDDFVSFGGSGPGCPVSDPDGEPFQSY